MAFAAGAAALATAVGRNWTSMITAGSREFTATTITVTMKVPLASLAEEDMDVCEEVDEDAADHLAAEEEDDITAALTLLIWAMMVNLLLHFVRTMMITLSMAAGSSNVIHRRSFTVTKDDPPSTTAKPSMATPAPAPSFFRAPWDAAAGLTPSRPAFSAATTTTLAPPTTALPSAMALAGFVSMGLAPSKQSPFANWHSEGHGGHDIAASILKGEECAAFTALFIKANGFIHWPRERRTPVPRSDNLALRVERLYGVDEPLSQSVVRRRVHR